MSAAKRLNLSSWAVWLASWLPGPEPGWEYYLDMLIASRDGTPLPSFDAYYPAQRDYFVGQVSKQ